MSFQDRHVVVTGGTGALGQAVVAALLAQGAICHVPHRPGKDIGPSRGHPGLRMVDVSDLTDEPTVTRFFGAVPDLWASIHLVGGFAAGPLAKADAANLRGQIEMNLVTCLLCCRAAVRMIAKAGAGGRIVNVAARPALEWRQGANMAAYAASKAGVAALTVSLAEEVAGQGILVNAIAPSIIDTPANRAAMPKADHASWPKPEEIARTILFLASPDNRVMRGAILPVYGKA
jgi:NAD(P)-dependent dehydrogenase (short-subunit alcohol dehydrogenase family)